MDDIKVLLLKSGQHIITKLSELTADSGESLCFVFEVPLIIRFVSGTSEQDTVISFNLWCPFSKSVAYRVPFEHVVTIGEPKDPILQKYIEYIQPLYPLIEGDAEPDTVNNLQQYINKQIEGE